MKKKKRLLVDLSSLKRLYSGLGQIAMGYGQYFQENYKAQSSPYELTLLLPRSYFGAFGNEVNYVSSSALVRRHLYDLFSAYDVWHSIHQLSYYKPRSSRTKVILTIHDLNYLYEKNQSSVKRYHNRIQHKIERADVIACISEFTRKEVESKLQMMNKTVRVIYNKVPMLDQTMTLPPRFEVQTPFFFTLGVIKKKKNFHTLLDVMKLMPERHLYIVGQGAENHKNEYAQYMFQRIKQEGITNVSLHAPISHAEKTWMYQHCQAFLFPSLYEGFGIPVIEAMQFEKPVFTSAETSLKEIGDKYVYFWHDFHPQSMKETIEKGMHEFYNDASLGEEAKKYARAFSTDRHFKQYEEIYATL